MVGRDTWNALRRAYEDVLGDLPEDYQQFAREIYPGRFIVLGDRGDTVLFLQQQLNRIAAQDPDIPAVAEDGIFGRGTQAAVLALQRKLGIDPTGAVALCCGRRSSPRERGIETSFQLVKKGQRPLTKEIPLRPARFHA